MRVDRQVVLVIPRRPPPSLNKLNRMHWAERKRHKDLWAEEIAVAAIEAGRPRFRRPLIQLRLYYPTQRRRDPDNAIGGPGKLILDGPREAGVIEDDNSQAIQLMPPVIAVDPDDPRVEIVLTELAEGRAAG